MTNKIGRNDRCPCGSGKKYKRCHINSHNTESKQAYQRAEEQKALEIQRKKQQGLGEPIITTLKNSSRLIQVGNSQYSGDWKTFHDFLFDYLKIVFGNGWWSSEISKPPKERHPIITLYDTLVEYKKKYATIENAVNLLPAIGAVSAYNWLSYNLYTIFHNTNDTKSHNSLMKRLRQIEGFSGACFETYVAAMFIKAGFTLEFEDEGDSDESHCEFTAIDRISGQRFSVEAKQRKRKNLMSPSSGSESYKLGVEALLNKALKKKAEHTRIVFIDINLPMSESTQYGMDTFVDTIRKCEDEDLNNESHLPSAYVFLTNFPFHHENEVKSTYYDPLFFAEGFKIPDFGNQKTKLHDAIHFRNKHKIIYNLWDSITQHQIIPVTFDGSIPEFSFGSHSDQIIIGHEYKIFDPQGNEQMVTLQDATVDKENQIVKGLCVGKNGQLIIVDIPLSKEAFRAYINHPDTFFGVHREQAKGIRSPLDAFDFLKKGFQNMSREELIKNLSTCYSHEDVLHKSTEELLDIYCEAMAPHLFQ